MNNTINRNELKTETPQNKLNDAWRILGKLGHVDTIFNHISIAWHDKGGELRITMNPDGYFPSEVSPEQMVTFPFKACDALDPKTLGVNLDGFELHSAVHRARMAPGVVLHTHSPYALAVGATSCGLLPISQTAIEFVPDAIFIDYAGLFRNLTQHRQLIEFCVRGGIAFLRNHGTLIITEEIEEAVYIQHFLEEACKIQIATLSQNQKVMSPSEDVVNTASDILKRDRRHEANKLFRAFKRTILN